MLDYNNKNIVLHELIGLDVEVTNCSDPDQIGISGRVVDETKNTLLIAAGKGTRRAIKKNSTFRFRKGSKSFIVDGEEINFRPHERIEKSLKFYRRRKL
jgi:ribonuclease P protein subunit POP4